MGLFINNIIIEIKVDRFEKIYGSTKYAPSRFALRLTKNKKIIIGYYFDTKDDDDYDNDEYLTIFIDGLEYEINEFEGNVGELERVMKEKALFERKREQEMKSEEDFQKIIKEVEEWT